jgi:hypothetical protein
MLTYTLLRRDAIAPDFGYVVSQHHTLMAARKALRRTQATATHVLVYSGWYVRRGSTMAIREKFLVPPEGASCDSH